MFYFAVLALLATGVRLMSGSGAFERVGMSFSGAIVAYFFGCIVAGSLVGLLLPLSRDWIGAALAGLLAFTPAFWLMNAVRVGWTASLSLNAVELSVMTGGLLGVVGGLYYWMRQDGSRRDAAGEPPG